VSVVDHVPRQSALLTALLCVRRKHQRKAGRLLAPERVHGMSLVLPFIITVTYSGVEAPAPQGARRENTGSI
jgi:hypothetical protein